MRNPLLLLLLLLVAAIAAGDCFMPYGPYVKAPAWSDAAVTEHGVITRQPVRSGGVVRMTVRLADGGRLVQLSAVADSVAPLPAVGDDVVFHSRIEAPHNAGNPGERDYAAYLRHQGVSGTAFCFGADWRVLGPTAHPNLRERMLRQRQRLVDLYAAHFDGETLAILAAMTLGDRTMVDRSTREIYSRTGSSHVLALSGLHLSILVGFLAFFLAPLRRRLGRFGDAVVGMLTLVLVWSFVLLAGLPVSLVRAATMLTIVVVLRVVSCTAPPFHALVVAMIVMLVAQPPVLFDVGFQLSVVSVAAIEGVARMRTTSREVGEKLASVHLRSLPLRLRFESLRMRLVPRRFRRGETCVLPTGRYTSLADRLFSPDGFRASFGNLFTRIGEVFPSIGEVFPRIGEVFPSIGEVFPSIGEVFPRIGEVFPSIGGLFSRFVRFLLSLLVVSLAAQIATLPLVAHYFGRVSLTGLLAAWIVIPTASAILFGALLFLLLPPLRPLLGAGLTWLVGTVNGLLAAIAAQPLASVPLALSWWGVVGMYAVLAAALWSARCILRGDRRRRFTSIALTIVAGFVVAAGEMLIAWGSRPPMRIAVYNTPAHMEIHLTTPETDSVISVLSDDARHVRGQVVSHAGRTVAVIDRRLPYVADVEMPEPLAVDVLLVTKGAKGHLDEMLLRYRPTTVALDACLSDYYRRRFAAEAAEAGLDVYDVEQRGALLLPAR